MQWSEAVNEHIAVLEPVKISPAVVMRLLSLVDLTSLNASDTEADIATLMEKARNAFGHVASVCVSPAHVGLVATQFAGSSIKAGTVANFPEGTDALEDVLIDIGVALRDGAQEIDVVFPYQRYLAGERQYAKTFVEACKAACGEQTLLKVILETGALGDHAIIADASYDVLAAGADFIKTSTGKITEGASLEAAATMLLVIKHMQPQLKRRLGFKASGGIRATQDATQYLALADQIMGYEWVSPDTFRIGASRLIDEMLKDVGGGV